MSEIPLGYIKCKAKLQITLTFMSNGPGDSQIPPRIRIVDPFWDDKRLVRSIRVITQMTLVALPDYETLPILLS